MKPLEEIDFSPLIGEFHLELVLLFGSQASGLRHRESDIDIAILIEKGYETDVNRLELMGRFVQLFGTDSVDVVCLNDADYFLRYEVTQHARVLFEAREDLYLDYACRAMKLYEAHKGLERLREDLLHEQVLDQ